MQIPIYQIDAFASRLFKGNPAAVCPLTEWPEDEVLQSVAAENNLSETAFFLPEQLGYHLRWFTPATEVDLCGHATLASAWVLWNRLGEEAEELRFRTRSGTLKARLIEGKIAMSFPSAPAEACPDPPEDLLEGVGGEPKEVVQAPYGSERNYLVAFESEEDVRSLTPDFRRLSTLEKAGVICTAPGESADFASRYFAPSFGIDEDPVTGSAHCTLTPYWSNRLDKLELYGHQVSWRGGEVWCHDLGERVIVAGRAVCYLEGLIFTEEGGG